VPILTEVLPSRNREGRVEVFVDGALFAVVLPETIGNLGLHRREEVSEFALASLLREQQYLLTLDRAMRMISVQSRSCEDLRRRLVQKKEPPEAVAAVIEKLVKLGLLDDASYSRAFTRSKMSSSGFAARRVSYELEKRGVARTTARQAIVSTIEEEKIDEGALLARTAEKKMRSLAKLDAQTQRRRLSGFLARRGFSGEQIARAVAMYIGRTQDSSEES
jgi:regulatory protein